MTATVGAATSGSPQEPISVTYRRLRRKGFADPEATNVIALKNGIAICVQPWTLRELANLLFLRTLLRAGSRWSDADDRAAFIGQTRPPAFEPPGQVPVIGVHPWVLPGPSLMATYARTIGKEA